MASGSFIHDAFPNGLRDEAAKLERQVAVAQSVPKGAVDIRVRQAARPSGFGCDPDVPHPGVQRIPLISGLPE
jgi:hypothetical protein